MNEFSSGKEEAPNEKEKNYSEIKQKTYWSDSEKAKFNEALRTFGKDWKKTAEFIGTRNSNQVRNYACHYKDQLIKSTKQDNNDLLEIL